MTVIGITGSIASGKTTVSQLCAKKIYPLFNADIVVKNLYKNSKFISLLIKKFKLNSKENIKKQIKMLIKKNKNKLTILETIIHPLVRKEMNRFLKKKNKFLILEIPLLIENKLEKHFDKIIFVYAKKKLRLKRYLRQNSDKEIFETLNKKQISPIIKKKACDLIINNNYSLAILKKDVKKLIAKI